MGIKTNGILNELFHTSTIDLSAISLYNKEIQKNGDAHKALELASRGTNKATINLMESAKGATVSRDGLTLAMNKNTLAAKAGAGAIKAFSIATNVIAMIAITKGIELAFKAFDNFVHSTQKAKSC